MYLAEYPASAAPVNHRSAIGDVKPLADLVEAYVGDAVLLRGRRAYGCFPDLLVERLSMYIHNGEGHMMESRMRDDHGLKRRLFSDGEGCGQPSARSR
jgi:hypothetical protein